MKTNKTYSSSRTLLLGWRTQYNNIPVIHFQFSGCWAMCVCHNCVALGDVGKKKISDHDIAHFTLSGFFLHSKLCGGCLSLILCRPQPDWLTSLNTASNSSCADWVTSVVAMYFNCSCSNGPLWRRDIKTALHSKDLKQLQKKKQIESRFFSARCCYQHPVFTWRISQSGKYCPSVFFFCIQACRVF